MTTPGTLVDHPLPVLKGDTLTERLRRIAAEPVTPVPLAGTLYRNVLIPGLVGGEHQFLLLGLLGLALQLRDVTVTALCCDSILPACSLRKVNHHESACTRWCHRNVEPFSAAIGLDHRWYSEFITEDERRVCESTARDIPLDQFAGFEWRGIPVGRLTLLSLESYYRVGTVDTDRPELPDVARDMLTAGLYLCVICKRAIETLGIDKVLLEDGQKNEWGIARAVALQQGIPVEVIQLGPRGKSISFVRDRPGTPSTRMPDWPQWRDTPLDTHQEQSLERYMEQRATRPYEERTLCLGSRRSTADVVRDTIGLPSATAGPVVGIFPNLSYEAGLTSSQNLFASPGDWVEATVERVRRCPGAHLVVKINPNEKDRRALDPLIPRLRHAFGSVPDNVHVVPPDTTLTAHDVLHQLDVALVYTSTVAIEAAYFGVPVVLVGGGRHAGRGITTDVSTREAYDKMLGKICVGDCPPPAPREVARRYAYAVFFRDLLPMRHYRTLDNRILDIAIERLEDLMPGGDAIIDFICRGVLLDEPLTLRYWS